MRRPDSSEAPPDEAGHLHRAALGGARAFAYARVAAEVATFGSAIVLARLLGPEAFGLAAVPLVATQVASALSSQGFGVPLVQKERLDEGDVEAAHTASLLCGAVFGVLIAGVGALAAGREPLMWVLAGVAVLLSAATAVPIASLQRKLDFRLLAILNGLAATGGAAAAVIAALAGLGPASLVVGALVAAATNLGALTDTGPRILVRLSFHAGRVRNLLSVGGPSAASGIVYFGTRNVDYLLLSARLPAADVGLYVRAYQYGAEYQAKISQILLQIALPIFARAENDDQLRGARRRMTRTHCVAVLPVQLMLIWFAPAIIPALFGSDWSGAVLPAQILGVIGIVNTLGTGAGPLLIAAGRAATLLRYNLLEFAVFAIAVLMGAQFGLVEACVAAAVARAATLVVLQRFVIQRHIGIPATETLVGDAVPGLVSGAVAVLAAALVASALDRLGVPIWVLVPTASVAAALGWAFVLRRGFPTLSRDTGLLAARVGVPAAVTGRVFGEQAR